MEIEKLLDELKRLNISQINQSTIWDVDDIAAYLKVSARHLYNHKVLTRSDFPRAIVIPITEDRPAKRWKAQEVVNWAQRIREVPAR